jgi:hypothetical protein
MKDSFERIWKEPAMTSWTLYPDVSQEEVRKTSVVVAGMLAEI